MSYAVEAESQLIVLMEYMETVIQTEPADVILSEYKMVRDKFSPYLGNILETIYSGQDIEKIGREVNILGAVENCIASLSSFDQAMDNPLDNKRLLVLWQTHVKDCQVFFMKARAVFLETPDQEIDNSEFDFTKAL